MIRFACPGCSSTFSVDDGKAGKSGKCPKCGAAFIIPAVEPPPVPVPPPPAPPSPPLGGDPNAPVEIDPCPKCQTKLSVAAVDLGNNVECPYCKTVFASARAGTRPPPPPAPPGRKSSADLDYSGKPKPRRDADEVEDDDRPRRRRRDDDDDDRPSQRKRNRDEDDDERPSRRGKPPVSRRDDDEDDDRPSRRKRSSRVYDDEDDDDYDDRPSRRRSRRRRSGGSGERSGAVTAASVMTIVVGALWLIGAGMIFFGSAYIFSVIGGLPRGVGGNPQARDAAEGALFGLAFCCGVPTLLMAILHILGGVFALQRKTAGRIIVIICASIALLLGLFSLYFTIRLLFLMPVTPPFEFVLYQFVNLLMTLGYGTFAMIVMCRSDYADEFD